jgi:hypothetical protein
VAFPLPGRPAQPGDRVGAYPAVQRGTDLGIAPLQIRDQDLAGEIVREDTRGSVVDERQPAQPVEQFRHVVTAQRDPQHRLGRGPRLGTHLQRLPVCRGRRAVHEPLQE